MPPSRFIAAKLPRGVGAFAYGTFREEREVVRVNLLYMVAYLSDEPGSEEPVLMSNSLETFLWQWHDPTERLELHEEQGDRYRRWIVVSRELKNFAGKEATLWRDDLSQDVIVAIWNEYIEVLDGRIIQNFRKMFRGLAAPGNNPK